ncbi:MAG: Spy/CpxP family protein refolding chaperone [Oscillatoriales cyanobacterium RM2_1_1]|nr:Spy/CpxP family protein refolding chaperone [Oscillatoriales cyanobacterium RM2_1_1]
MGEAFANPISGSFQIQAQRQAQIQAQRPAQRQDRQERGVEGLLDELNTTPEQRKKMREIYNRYRNEITNRRQQWIQLQQELNALMVGNASEGEIRRKHEELEQVRQDKDKIQLEMLLKMRDILTPAQRDQFAEIMEQRRYQLQGDR